MKENLTLEQGTELDSVLQMTRPRPSSWYNDKPYRVVRAQTLPHLESVVDNLHDEGWTPLGSPTLNFFRRSSGNIQLVCLQGLWRQTNSATSNKRVAQAESIVQHKSDGALAKEGK